MLHIILLLKHYAIRTRFFVSFNALLCAILRCAVISRVARCVAVKTNLSTNLALMKPVTSSDLNVPITGTWYHPSKAVDGSRDPRNLNGHCYHSMPQTNAWWQVDLQGVYVIREVVIANRADTCCCKLGVTLVSVLFNRAYILRVCM